MRRNLELNSHALWDFLTSVRGHRPTLEERVGAAFENPVSIWAWAAGLYSAIPDRHPTSRIWVGPPSPQRRWVFPCLALEFGRDGRLFFASSLASRDNTGCQLKHCRATI